jgi:hypothetical protein
MSAAQSQVVNLLVLGILIAYVLYLPPWRRGRSRARGTRFDRFALLLDHFGGAFLAGFLVALAVFGVGAVLWPTVEGQRPASAEEYISLAGLLLLAAILCLRAVQRWVRRPARRPQLQARDPMRLPPSVNHRRDRQTISCAPWRSMYSLTPRG